MEYAPTEAVYRKVIEAGGCRLEAAEFDHGDRMRYEVWKDGALLVEGEVRVLDFEDERAARLVAEVVLQAADAEAARRGIAKCRH